MKTIQICSNVYVFQFDLEISDFSGTVNVSAIIGNEKIYLIDTSYRSQHMRKVLSYLSSISSLQTYLVFNTHSDFDHIMGNCLFPHSERIATIQCYKQINKLNIALLKKQFPLAREDFFLAPSLVFANSIFYPNDQIEFFSNPIHTKDSASCFYGRESILFAGDNVESPLPYLTFPIHSSTIQEYDAIIKRNPKIIVPGHGDPLTMQTVYQNKKYLQDLQNNRVEMYERPPFADIHQTNLINICESDEN